MAKTIIPTEEQQRAIDALLASADDTGCDGGLTVVSAEALETVNRLFAGPRPYLAATAGRKHEPAEILLQAITARLKDILHIAGQYDGAMLPSITAAATRAAERAACILTGADGENPDDCTTHEHEAQQPEKAPDFRFGCPECKSENVTEINLVEVRLAVNAWDADGEPTDFGSWITTGDTIGTRKGYEGILSFDNDPRYHCEDCDHDFDTPAELGKDGPA